jgi:hypothetical protein
MIMKWTLWTANYVLIQERDQVDFMRILDGLEFECVQVQPL